MPDSLPHTARAPIAHADWERLLDEHGAEHGYHKRLGNSHGALFTEDDDILIVTFEPAEAIRAAKVPLPFGLTLAGRKGWSHLGLYCEGETFFRDDAVFAYFDALVDDGFFDQFSRVVFYGAGACGYAAAAFSVVAPGAEVVLVRPLATLDPALTEWDRRHPRQRRTDFSNRYGYAPDMIEAAENVTLIYDPQVIEDAMHAALFERRDVLRLKTPGLGHAPEEPLTQMGVLAPLLLAAGKAPVTGEVFFGLYRRRFEDLGYLARVLTRLKAANRICLMGIWARAALEHVESRGLRAVLAKVEQQLAAEGRSLPPPHRGSSKTTASA
ncbi:hypothetical protein CLV78_102384 [Aliiruegeria haliotis]|uniref:Phosphoadenosine phosphosulfate reductase n=1 Tax=Aliiruegeria haliotis TaxID=1280846 RepID=A0A2T0RVM9_9RHOB|nr:phosphoadenosine phosphosulfate reductase [Aliiruegeria haliotis]PRY25207.1 hypothetical protein CLV78_102384 [Aliiruegeria haliotis]